MTTQFPPNNLNDESQRWRRFIEEELIALKKRGSFGVAEAKSATRERNSLRRTINDANLTLDDEKRAREEARRVPMLPEEPQASSDAYFDAYGYPKAILYASSQPVSTDTVGEAIEIDHYQLWGRPHATPIGGWRMLGEDGPIVGEGPNFTISELPAGEEWDVRIRAVSIHGTPGEFSGIVTLTLAKDTTPPPQPATPTGDSRLGQVSLAWNGKTSGGQSMPADFSHAEVWIANTNTDAGAMIGQIGAPDTFYPPTQPYNAARYYWVVAVDYAGNRSTPSGRLALTTKPLVDTDVIGKVIDEANLDDNLSGKINDAQSTANQAATDAANALTAAGLAAVSIITEYAKNTSATTAPTTGWATTSPSHTAGSYIWMRQVTTYGDSSSSTSNPVLVTGNTGPKGDKGDDGQGITISGSVATYANLPTGLGAADAGKSYLVNADGKLYIWSGSAWPPNGQGVAFQGPAGNEGQPGDPGPAGVGVASVTTYYLLASTTPAKPTTNPPGGGWSTTEPGYTSGLNLYRSDLIVLTDNSFGWSAVSRSAAYTASAQAITAANLADAAAKGTVKASQTDPGHQVGRIWLVLNAAGDSIGIKISNGSSWTSYALMADQVLVPSSIGTVSIAEGAITAPKILGGTITGDKIAGETITGSNIVGQTITGAKIAALTIEAGNIKANAVTADKINAGAVTAVKIDTGAVTADKILASAVTTVKLAAGAITAVKLDANAVTTDKLAANAITSKHTITGALIRTSASGARTEMNTSGIRVLNSSGVEQVRLGYGIAAGMSVRNPHTNSLVELSDAAFGLEGVSSNVHRTFAVSYNGYPSSPKWSSWRRHSATDDDCILTFTAVTSQYVINFSEAFTCSYTSAAGASTLIILGLEVNGKMITSSGFDVVAPMESLNAYNSDSHARYITPQSSAVIATTPGSTYRVLMRWKDAGSGTGSGTVSCAVRNRYITATPIFR